MFWLMVGRAISMFWLIYTLIDMSHGVIGAAIVLVLLKLDAAVGVVVAVEDNLAVVMGFLHLGKSLLLVGCFY